MFHISRATRFDGSFHEGFSVYGLLYSNNRGLVGHGKNQGYIEQPVSGSNYGEKIEWRQKQKSKRRLFKMSVFKL